MESTTPAADDRRREIVRQAALLFDKSGYNHVSISNLAASVGLQKASLYHYFNSKDDILYSIHDDFIDLLLEREASRRESGRVDSWTASRRLLAVIEDIMSLMVTHRGHVRVFFEHHRELPPELGSRIRRKRDEYQRMVEEIIEAGIESGDFKPNGQAHLTSFALFGMCNWSYQWFNPTGAMTSVEVARVFWDVLMRGIEQDHTHGL